CNVIGSIVGYCIYNIFLKAINKFNIRLLGKTNSKGVELVDK
ncbi:VanZ family protein, partial [Bacillus thuringiensis]|nr:VanZ family protein [Bacillus thuringiensis]